MSDIRFSTAEHFPNASRFFQKLVDDPSRTAVSQVKVKAVPWDWLWAYLQAVVGGDAKQDLSEVGSTWVSHFIDKGGLLKLSHTDIENLGGEGGFFPATWESTRMLSSTSVYAVPWLADTRVVYYWRSHLRSTGVDEVSAFTTPEQMTQTLAALRDKGKPGWGAPTFEVNNTLHQIASWIWSNGGDFLDETGVSTLFCEPVSVKAICDYYWLYRYMPQSFDSLAAVLDRFEERRVSVIIDGPWFLMRMILGGATDETLDDLGVSLPPGPPFVGGSNLVVWRTCDNPSAALTLVRYLTSGDVQREICKATGLLPVRPDILDETPYSTDPHYQVFKQALQYGRPVPAIPFWGPLEDSLRKGFGAIWEDIKASRDCSVLNSIVLHHLTPIAKRFDRLLKLVASEPAKMF